MTDLSVLKVWNQCWQSLTRTKCLNSIGGPYGIWGNLIMSLTWQLLPCPWWLIVASRWPNGDPAWTNGTGLRCAGFTRILTDNRSYFTYLNWWHNTKLKCPNFLAQTWSNDKMMSCATVKTNLYLMLEAANGNLPFLTQMLFYIFEPSSLC